MADRASVAATATLSALFVLCAGSDSMQARVQDYQIVRLLSYKTECQLVHLENRSTAKGPMLFFATCDNVSFYPDGIDIVCDDRDDDRSCRVLTREKIFDQLHLLDQNRQR